MNFPPHYPTTIASRRETGIISSFSKYKREDNLRKNRRIRMNRFVRSFRIVINSLGRSQSSSTLKFHDFPTKRKLSFHQLLFRGKLFRYFRRTSGWLRRYSSSVARGQSSRERKYHRKYRSIVEDVEQSAPRRVIQLQ